MSTDDRTSTPIPMKPKPLMAFMAWLGTINTVTTLGVAVLMALCTIVTSPIETLFATAALALCQLLLKAQRIMYFFKPNWQPPAIWHFWSPVMQLGDIIGKIYITSWSLKAMMLAGGMPAVGAILLTTFVVFAMVLKDFLRNNAEQLKTQGRISRFLTMLRQSAMLHFYGVLWVMAILCIPCVLLITHRLLGLSMAMLLQQPMILAYLSVFVGICLCAVLIRYSDSLEHSCINLCLIDTFTSSGLVMYTSIMPYSSSPYLIFMAIFALTMALAQWWGSSCYLHVYFNPQANTTSKNTPVQWLSGISILTLWAPSLMSALGTCISKCTTALTFMQSRNIPIVLGVPLTLCLGLAYFVRDLSNWIYNHLKLKAVAVDATNDSRIVQTPPESDLEGLPSNGGTKQTNVKPMPSKVVQNVCPKKMKSSAETTPPQEVMPNRDPHSYVIC